VRGHERHSRQAAEQVRLAEDRHDDRVRDDARQDRRHERVRLEVVAVQHLHREQRRAERGAEDRRDACRDAGDDEQPPFPGARREQAPHERSEPRADLHRRPFPAAGASRREHQHRRERLHRDDPRADEPAVPVIGVDRRISPSAGDLRRDTGEEPAREPAERGERREEPRPELRRAARGREQRLARAQRLMSGEGLEQQHLAPLERGEERGPRHAGHAADERGVQQGLAEEAERQRRADGEPPPGLAEGRRVEERRPWPAHGREDTGEWLDVQLLPLPPPPPRGRLGSYADEWTGRAAPSMMDRVNADDPRPDALDADRLGPVLGFMRALWEVDHALFSASKRMKGSLGVTGPERLVIRIVGELPDISPGELADVMHVDPSTLTGLLGRMVRRKLVARSTDPRDARRSRLRLLPGGAAIDRVRSGTVEAGVRVALEALAPRDVATTVVVLGAVSRVLNGLTFAPARPPRRRGAARATAASRAGPEPVPARRRRASARPSGRR
jgi:DNA-binding MarR family transcriptional regulator